MKERDMTQSIAMSVCRNKQSCPANLKLKFSLLLTVFLGGCGDQPKELTDMSQQIAAVMTEINEDDTTKEAISLDLEFGQTILMAVKANDGYQAAVDLEAEAFERIGVAASSRRVQLTSNATLGGVHESGGSAPDTTTKGVAASITISQLIYDGGASTSAVNQSTAEALRARAQREALANDLALEAARAWIDVWQFDERLRVLHSRTDEMDTMFAQMERMAASGLIDKAAIDSARRKMIDITLEKTRIQADLNEAQIRFRRFFNQEASKSLSLPELTTPDEVRNVASAWQQSPILESSAAELLIARNAVVSAEAAFQPRARLQATTTSPMKLTDSTDTSIGVVIEYQFGDGGRRAAQLLSAQARAEALEGQLIDSQNNLRSEIDAALTRLLALERSMPQLTEQINMSASEAATLRSQIATGQSNLLQLVNAEVENYRAQDRQIAMRAAREMIMLTVLARTGEFGRQIGLTQELPDASK